MVIGTIRPVARGGAWEASAPPIFGRSVNPISTRGSRLCPPKYYEPPRIFRPCDGPASAWTAPGARAEDLHIIAYLFGWTASTLIFFSKHDLYYVAKDQRRGLSLLSLISESQLRSKQLISQLCLCLSRNLPHSMLFSDV